MSLPEYQIYSIRYARNLDRRRPENFIGGDPHDVPMPMNFYVWAIVGSERTYLLDTGFDAVAGAARGREVDRSVDDGLRTVGIKPSAVKDVILSHMHWDHAGNHDLFPSAHYHVQDTEMAYCTGRCMCHMELRRPFSAGDVQAMVGRVFESRARFHDGTATLARGLSLHLVGGHSKGLQCVRVHTRRGWVVLASDAAHYYDHLTEQRVFPLTYNVGDTIEGYRLVNELASSPAHVIPGHDPKIQERYPLLQGVADVVRLDADPV